MYINQSRVSPSDTVVELKEKAKIRRGLRRRKGSGSSGAAGLLGGVLEQRVNKFI